MGSTKRTGRLRISMPLTSDGMLETLRGWLRESVRDFTLKLNDVLPDDNVRYSATFYTAEHSYAISASLRKDGSGYIGCTASTRSPRAGENWTRGNDLPDGPFCRDTWNAILHAVVRYETVRIYARPDGDISDRTMSPDDLERVANAVVGIQFTMIDGVPTPAGVSWLQAILLNAMEEGRPYDFTGIYRACVGERDSEPYDGYHRGSDIDPTSLLLQILREITAMRIVTSIGPGARGDLRTVLGQIIPSFERDTGEAAPGG